MIRMENGILYVQEKPQFLLTADYPYYRDSVENWADRLERLKRCHINVISFYVPWRHHHVGDIIDFEGVLSPNKNVKLFIKLCREKGLSVLLKPGPFVHAETDFGGLPDFVSPEYNESIDPMLNASGEQRKWHKVLPSPTDPQYNKWIQEWFELVDRELIQPNQYPQGPIIALQILNEGIYSDAQHVVTDYDYSVTSIKMYQQFLEEKYETIAEYNRLHGTKLKSFFNVLPVSEMKSISNLAEVLLYKDWAEYQSYYMSYLYSHWGNFIKSDLPYILNLNPPHDREQGYDDWLNRLEIEKFTNQNYGFTNWIGVVSHDTSAFNRYLLLTKRGRGPNLEENWGFSKLYDSRYKYTAIPFFQTIMAVAAGATGYNIYTGVATDQWDDNIDTLQQKPYPDCSPITEQGELTDKYFSLKLLNRFFLDFGSELMESASSAPLTWGIYNGYSQLGCWGLESEIKSLGKKSVYAGRNGFDHFQNIARQYNIDYSMVNIAESDVPVDKHPMLVLVGGFFMDEKTQRNLVRYVKSGGILNLTHDVPALNENFEPCTYLREEIFGGLEPTDGEYLYGKGKVLYTSDNLFAAAEASKKFISLLEEHLPASFLIRSDAQVWIHSHPHKNVQFVFVLGLDDQVKNYNIQYLQTSIQVRLPVKSSCIIRMENGLISAGVIKGIHELEQSAEAPYISDGKQMLKAEQACDLFFRFEGGIPIFEAASPDDELILNWTEENGRKTAHYVVPNRLFLSLKV
ncbi:MAG: Beta-galactosidase-like protein [Bacilli bacterium]|nr:Beta-galactosidase-like protein [Bacilli bacterium]